MQELFFCIFYIQAVRIFVILCSMIETLHGHIREITRNVMGIFKIVGLRVANLHKGIYKLKCTVGN